LVDNRIRQLQDKARPASVRDLDPELATAMAADEIMRAERSPAQDELLEALMQWCAIHLHDPAYRHWVSFRFPESLDHFNLVQIQRPESDLPESLIGPDSRLRRRDGFALTDPL